MIKLIPRKDVFEHYPLMPWIVYDPVLDEHDFHMPKGIAYMILSRAAPTYTQTVNKTGKELMLHFKRLKLENFLIMGAEDTPWRFRQRRHTDLKVTRIMEFFTESGIRPRFDGAVSVSLADLAVWFKNILSAVRVNALVPEMFFMDINQSLYFSPCQYGNLHLTILDQLILSDLNNAINQSELIRISAGRCGSESYNTAGIPCRRSTYY